MAGGNRSIRASAAAAAVAAGCAFAPASAPAGASTTHVVAPAETLSGIAAANGLSTEILASWNGLAADDLVVEGTTLTVPSPEEAGTGSATATAPSGTAGGHVVAPGETLSAIAAVNGVALADLAAANGLAVDGTLLAGATLQIPAATAAPVAAAAPALGEISSPAGTLYLDPAAAEAWNLMRDAALAEYGVDLYPAGSLSAYRTAEQQGELYDLFLSGVGAPANPPGGSSHELGLSVDLADESMLAVVDEIGWRFGWGRFEAPDEWWHVTYGG